MTLRKKKAAKKTTAKKPTAGIKWVGEESRGFDSGKTLLRYDMYPLTGDNDEAAEGFSLDVHGQNGHPVGSVMVKDQSTADLVVKLIEDGRLRLG